MSLTTILLAVGDDETDEIEQLAETAIDIAGPAGATVTLGHILSQDEYTESREKLQFGPDSEVTPSVVTERNTRFQDLGEILAAADVESTVEARLKNGETVGERLAELAEDISADLVIVGGRGRTPAGKAVFGSTAQTVLLNAPCPVTYVRSD